jgi:hypothetical protein
MWYDANFERFSIKQLDFVNLFFQRKAIPNHSTKTFHSSVKCNNLNQRYFPNVQFLITRSQTSSARTTSSKLDWSG